MSSEVQIDELVKEFGGCGLDEFLARVPDPHLLIVVAPNQHARSTDFTTLKLRGRSKGRDHPALLRVKKRLQSNPFAMMITLGRAANNDLILPDPDVSKLHCYFHRFQGGWTICDPGSTNGTLLDGRKVADRGVPLRSGARVRLADAYEFLFLEPTDLHGLVSGRVQATALRREQGTRPS